MKTDDKMILGGLALLWFLTRKGGASVQTIQLPGGAGTIQVRGREEPTAEEYAKMKAAVDSVASHSGAAGVFAFLMGLPQATLVYMATRGLRF